jgi:hypothetical protein
MICVWFVCRLQGQAARLVRGDRRSGEIGGHQWPRSTDQPGSFARPNQQHTPRLPGRVFWCLKWVAVHPTAAHGHPMMCLNRVFWLPARRGARHAAVPDRRVDGGRAAGGLAGQPWAAGPTGQLAVAAGSAARPRRDRGRSGACVLHLLPQAGRYHLHVVVIMVRRLA